MEIRGIRINPDIIALAAAAVVLAAVVSAALPYADDWTNTFRPAALMLLEGRSPFDVPTYYNPPWTAIILLPLAILPDPVGRGVLFVVTLAGFALVARRMEADRVALVAFLLAPSVIHCLLTGNLDGIALLGLVIPPQWGALLLAIKPQVGGIVILFWTIRAWKDSGWKESARTLLPLVITGLLSLAIFGLWPLRPRPPLVSNTSLWPMTIPVGLGLIVAAVKRMKIGYAMGAGPCLTPYLSFQSWTIALAAVLRDRTVTVAAVVGMWVMVGVEAVV